MPTVLSAHYRNPSDPSYTGLRAAEYILRDTLLRTRGSDLSAGPARKLYWQHQIPQSTVRHEFPFRKYKSREEVFQQFTCRYTDGDRPHKGGRYNH